MSVRTILLGADENGEGGVFFKRGTSVKDSPNHESDTVPCFDEVVPQGNDTAGGTLEIEKLVYDSVEEYIALSKQLMKMTTEPTMITTFEEMKFKNGEPYRVQKNYKNCLLSGNDKEDKPNEHSVRSLKFTYTEVVEKVNDEEIKLD